MLLPYYIQRICWILEKIVDWQGEDMKTSENCIMEMNLLKIPNG